MEKRTTRLYISSHEGLLNYHVSYYTREVYNSTCREQNGNYPNAIIKPVVTYLHKARNLKTEKKKRKTKC